jgi:GNAT superfamily N-acetyltransferase
VTTDDTDIPPAVARERLLAALPDTARWVYLRSSLLQGEGEVFGPLEACAVASGGGGPGSEITVVGGPEPRWLHAAARRCPGADVLVPPEVRAQVEGLARRPPLRITLHLLPPERALPVVHPTRILGRGDAGGLRHVPEDLREELLDALARVPVAAACAGDLPVAFCYPADQTETLWDIGIDTLEAHRRRGFAASAAAAMARHLAPTGRRPVWSAAEDNPASLRLASKLGFEPVDELFLWPASVFLRGAGSEP